MRLGILPIVSLLAFGAAGPAQATVLPPEKAQDVRDPKSPVAETDIDKTIYDDQGRPIPNDRVAPSSPRRSLAENLRIRNRRGYTISFEPGEVIAIEQSGVAHLKAREDLTALALAEIVYGSLSAGDTSLLSRIQPLASSFQPLWVALVPMSVVNPSTGQTVTVLVDVLGPSVGQNGLLSPIGGNTVLANALVAPAPVVSDVSDPTTISTPQSFRPFFALPNQVNDAEELSDPPSSQFDANDDAKPKQAAVSNTEIAAVPELSTWAMMLVGFGSLGLMICVKSRYASI